MWGSGEQYRDFLYIDDVLDALVLMAQKGMNQARALTLTQPSSLLGGPASLALSLLLSLSLCFSRSPLLPT